MLIQARDAICLDVLAHGLGHAVVQANVSQVSNRHVGEKSEHSGEGCQWIANEGKT